jgi:hypothetical protein
MTGPPRAAPPATDRGTAMSSTTMKILGGRRGVVFLQQFPPGCKQKSVRLRPPSSRRGAPWAGSSLSRRSAPSGGSSNPIGLVGDY